ncbi:MAG: S1C family serine protease, partial [Nitrospinales bacterium]
MFKADCLKKNICLFVALFFLWIGVSVSATANAEKLWTEKKPRVDGEEIVLSDSLFRRLAETLSPAVVNIQILHKVSTPYYREFPFRPAPGAPSPEDPDQLEEVSGGSGFIIHKKGYILTNAHVVADSEEMQVSLANGKLFKGKVIGTDTLTDIALVKIDVPYDLTVLPLGSSEDLKPGDWVMAIGSPFGLDQTVTVGIVSAKGRSLGASPFDDYIQTDASINPGNSGGPLINTRGEVVGINSAILAQGQGLGFSLPIDLVKIIVPQLKEKGEFTR